MKYISVLFCLFLVISCGQLPKDTSRWNSLALKEIINEYHQFQKALSPFSQPGIADNNTKLPDLSPHVLLSNYQDKKKIYQKLLKINPKTLSQSDQINWSVLAYKIKNQLDNYINKEHYMPLTAESGFHVGISWISKRVQFKVEQDYRDYIKRMAALPTYFDQQMAWMDLGIKEGITQPGVVLIGFEESIKAFIKDDVTESEFYQPFKKMPKHFTAKLSADLKAQAQQIIQEKVTKWLNT